MTSTTADNYNVSSPRWVPFLIYLAAFVIRLIYLLEIKDMPTLLFPIMDEKYHLFLAGLINSPGGFPAEPYFRAPLYYYLLAGALNWLGNSLTAVRVVQILGGAFIPVLTFFLGKKLFTLRTAYIASVIAVFYPTLIYFDITFLITSLMTLLSLLLLIQCYRTEKKLTTPNFIICGLLLGLTALARPNVLLFGPALFLWIWLVVKNKIGWKDALVNYIIIGIACLVIIAPVTIRNYQIGKDKVLIAWQGGFNFYLGNNRQASGWSATVPGIDFSWQGGYDEAIRIAEADKGRPLKKSEISDYWYDKTFDEISEDPLHFAGLLVKKLRLFFNGYEIPNNQDIYYARKHSSLMSILLHRGLLYFPFGLIAPLALVGLYFTFARWRRFLIVYLFSGIYIFSFLLFFVCARFRQPLIPIFILLAVYGFSEFFRRLKKARKSKLKVILIPLIIFILMLLESNHDMLGIQTNRIEAMNYFTQGAALLENDEKAEAEKYFLRAWQADPAYAPALNNLGLLQAERGNLTQARDFFRKAIKLEPMSVENYLNLATTFVTEKKYDQAVAVLKLALNVNPRSDRIYYRLALTYFSAGEFPEAENSVKEALRLNPENHEARELFHEILRNKNR